MEALGRATMNATRASPGASHIAYKHFMTKGIIFFAFSTFNFQLFGVSFQIGSGMTKISSKAGASERVSFDKSTPLLTAGVVS
ncbi:MAG: hypothetical protein WCR42_03000 [bacterium]